MKRASILFALAGLLAPGAAVGAEAPASMTAHRCYVCHADRQALAGPAFEEVAVAWRGQRDAAARMAAVIRGGSASGGPWHMPPHPEVTPREARAMARYILSLDPAPPGRTVRPPGEPAPKRP